MFKRFLIALILSAVCVHSHAADIVFPALTGRVVDDAHIIDPAVAQQIDNQIAKHEQQSSDQIVVVTVPDLKDIPIEDYGYRLGRDWGIGQKGKNNGVILIVAPKEHKVRIEVGYGLEGELTDAASSVIINRLITPAFKQGDFNRGISQGVTAIIDCIQGTNINDLPKDNSPDNKHLIILILVFLFFLWWLRRKGAGGSGILPFMTGWSIGSGTGGGNDDDDGPSFSGGGGSFGGGGSTGSW